MNDTDLLCVSFKCGESVYGDHIEFQDDKVLTYPNGKKSLPQRNNRKNLVSISMENRREMEKRLVSEVESLRNLSFDIRDDVENMYLQKGRITAYEAVLNTWFPNWEEKE